MEPSSRDRQSEGKRRTEITMFGCGESEVDQREGTEQRTQVSTAPRTSPLSRHTHTHPTILDPNLASLQPNLVKILPRADAIQRAKGRGRDGGKNRGFGKGHKTKV